MICLLYIKLYPGKRSRSGLHIPVSLLKGSGGCNFERDDLPDGSFVGKPLTLSRFRFLYGLELKMVGKVVRAQDVDPASEGRSYVCCPRAV